MRVVQIFNQQRSIGGGAENVALQTTEWLREAGIETELLLRSSRDLEDNFGQKVKAALTGIYNPKSYSFLRDYIAQNRPSVIHAHNLYPQWSPSVLLAARDAGVPTLFTVHSQILTCPTWYHLCKGQVCENCLHSSELWCVLRNCRGSYLESAGYAVRSFIVRKRRWIRDNVTVFIAPSEFMRRRLISAGFPAERIQTIWNAVPIPERAAEPVSGEYVAFAGRFSQEKGVDVLLATARELPGVPFRLAGTGPMEAGLRERASPNVAFSGFLRGKDLANFYQNARLLVLPSISHETFPLSAAEGMAFGLPIVASRSGGLPELVNDGVSGHLVTIGNIAEFSAAITKLWDDPDRCGGMGLAGREWAKAHLTKATYIAELLAAYRDAQNIVDETRPQCSNHA